MKKLLLLVMVALLCASCATTIKRWSLTSSEKISREIPVQRRASIFEDYKWTMPAIKSIKIQDSFVFNQHAYKFSVNGSSLILNSNGTDSKFEKLKSIATYYYDSSKLIPTMVSRQRWVPRTKYVNEMVPVQRNRQVPFTTFDAKGMAHTSFRSEFYTDWESRTVAKTEWVWETYTEQVFVIPDTDYFDIRSDQGDHFIIYVEPQNSSVNYYLQNPEYYVASEKNDTFFGSRDMNMIFVDADSDGSYFSPSDKMLFNVWNPYDKNSEFRSIANVMDNYWYNLQNIGDNYFVRFAVSGNNLNIENENELFVGSKETGEVTIQNIEKLRAKIMINGKSYRVGSGDTLKTQYGKYRIIISVPNHVDYEEVYVIDKDHPQKVINYQLTPVAATIKVRNIFSPTYKISVDGEGFSRIYFNTNTISVPFGTYQLTITVNGFQLHKELHLAGKETVDIDFERELHE